MTRHSEPPRTVPFERIDVDDDGEGGEGTASRELLGQAKLRGPARSALESAFFAPLPIERRAEVASMFHRKTLAIGAVVVRQGEIGHPLVVVARGRLDVRAERSDGLLVQVGSIAIGEYIGETAIQRTPATAHVVAATDAEVMLLSAPEVIELARIYPALWAELKHVGERRTREYGQRIRTP